MGSENPDDHLATAGEARVVGSEDLDSRVVGSEQMHEVNSEQLEDHQGASHALQDLPEAHPDAGYRSLGSASDADEPLDPSMSAEEIVALRKLQQAEAAAREARTAYGDMMQRNYPTGEARERIVARRDLTEKIVEHARSELEALRE
jgi:hypothetical protein